MGKVFLRKKFSDYLGESRSLLDIYIGNVPDPSSSPIPSPTPTPSASATPLPPTPTPSATSTSIPPTPTPSVTQTATSTTVPPTPTPSASATPIPPTPTPSATSTPILPTGTPTSTPTPSPTNAVCVETCDVLLQGKQSSTDQIYLYNITANTLNNLIVPSVTESIDIAHTSNKMFLPRKNGASYDGWNGYDITLCPWSASTPTFYPYPSGVFTPDGGLFMKDDNTLIIFNQDAGRYFQEVDVTTTATTATNVFQAIAGRKGSTGDFMLTSDGKLIWSNDTISGPTQRYLSQYDYATGALEVDILLTGLTNIILGIFEGVDSFGNKQIYLAGNTGELYTVDRNSPYTITNVATIGMTYLGGASSILSCNTESLVVPTPTPTTTSTPTATPVPPTETPTSTPTNTPTATPASADCSWSGTTSLWENNTNEWGICSNLPTPTPSVTPSVTSEPTTTPTNTPTPSPTTPIATYLLYESGDIIETEQGDLLEPNL